ncbi:uncharacterized protein LOC133782017 [Humulus lupulus]|uniref:uncharacterized protein LOC133782017 n=1 Tax=Humulus lupulus TaxID=3486 RepID=UPI002B4132BE|nr:uncharacterized protein LOC133782017 [Humulus lupulus]
MRQPNCSRKNQHAVLLKTAEDVTETTPGVVGEATSNMPESGAQTSNGRPQQTMDTIAVPINQIPLVEERETLIERIYNLGASKFNGSASPDDAEEWIQRLEEIFDIIGCSDEEKLSLARFLLEQDAFHWWKGVRHYCYPYPSTITWGDFRREFYDKYFPRTYRDAKLSEFLQLKQGYMTVREYEDKFISLVRFARALVANEVDMCRRFEDGLRRDIRMIVTAVGWTEFRGLVDAAQRVELCISDHQSNQEQQQRIDKISGRRG